jgi:hypothetical protein
VTVRRIARGAAWVILAVAAVVLCASLLGFLSIPTSA